MSHMSIMSIMSIQDPRYPEGYSGPGLRFMTSLLWLKRSPKTGLCRALCKVCIMFIALREMVSQNFFASDEGKRFPHSVFPGAMYVLRVSIVARTPPGLPLNMLTISTCQGGYQEDVCGICSRRNQPACSNIFFCAFLGDQLGWFFGMGWKCQLLNFRAHSWFRFPHDKKNTSGVSAF